MNHAKLLAVRFKQDESGQNLVEYAIVVTLVALAAIATMGQFGSAIRGAFEHMTGQLNYFANNP